MKNFIIYLGILIVSTTVKMFGQEQFEYRAKQIAVAIEQITKEEKANLKEKIAQVNEELGKGLLTHAQADERKIQLAEATAKSIENRVTAEENKLTQLVKEKVEGRIVFLDTVEKKTKRFEINWSKKDTLNYSEKRTTTQFVFALGVNNLVTNNSVSNTGFRYLGSHFYEWGLSWNTRVLKENNLLHFKYGASLQYNNLRPTDNRFFVDKGEQTTLENFGKTLEDSRLRLVNLVMPLYVEFDFSDKKNYKGKSLFRTHDSFRMGFGGYFGANLKAKQILNYEENGGDFQIKEKADFNVNDFVYGLGAYIGYKETSLYLKYDLNPLFRSNIVDQNNISLGLRFDFN